MKPTAGLERRRVLAVLGSLCPVALGVAEESLPAPAPPGRRSAIELATEDRVALALMKFREGYHCSQSVFAAYSDDYAIDPDLAMRLSAGLAGGSTVGGECGAIGAAYLVLGLRHGRDIPAAGDTERERELFGRIRQLVEQFREKHGSINCRDLLGVDVFTKEGHEEGLRQGLYQSRCTGFIQDVISIVDSLE